MMKKIKLAFLFLLCSCVVDTVRKIGVVKNLSDFNISVVYSTQPNITDEELFYRGKVSVPAGGASEIYGNSVEPNLYFFFFNEDTVYQYIKMGKVDGIVKQSFLGKSYVNNEKTNVNDTILFKP